jgi:hypothetical protein
LGVTSASSDAPTLTRADPAPHRAVRRIPQTLKSSRYWPTSTFIPITLFAIATGCNSSMPSSVQVAVIGKTARWLGEGEGITYYRTGVHEDSETWVTNLRVCSTHLQMMPPLTRSRFPLARDLFRLRLWEIRFPCSRQKRPI